jgi:aspartyl-tRNA(Asn)/glutamyl-tRNA(Gln) amidotransferase subunit C
MADISADDVRRLAGLARIYVAEEDVAQLQSELTAILGYVEILNQVEVSGLVPTSQVTGLENVSRPDETLDDTMNREELLKQAPDVKDGQVKVEKVL